MAESTAPAPGVTQRQHELLIGRALPSGVLGRPEDPSLVYAPGSGTREIRIRASRVAVVEGYLWQTDAVELVKTLAANTSGSTRVDLVVLRLDKASYTVTVQVVQGTPGAGAPSPTYDAGSSGVWELPLATVTVANNATTLAGSTVNDIAWYVGGDGQILIRSANRSWLPHEPFRMAGETDTGRVVMSAGSSWNTVIDDSGAVSITLSSGWSATRNRVQRRGGTAVLALTVQRSSPLSGDTSYQVGQLPAGFFPTFEVPGVLLAESTGGLSVSVRVTTSGAVWVDTPPSLTVAAGRPLSGSVAFHTA